MTRAIAILTALCIVGGSSLAAQRGRGNQPPATGRDGAPFDLTGTWVSVVTEDWRWRMVTPPKGDYTRVPLTPAGRKVADGWDPAADVMQGNQCRPFGAANIMRMPGRLQIAWVDPGTLQIDYDAGTQRRLITFDTARPTPAERTWQGWSVAEWEISGRSPDSGAPRYGSLKVVTTNIRGGYLRTNGVPYSERAVMTEYFDRHSEPNGNEWFTVMTVVEDPVYLTQPFILTTSFLKEADSSKWRPRPCETPAPLK